jgi:probable rRNA maturation factor
MIVNRQRRVRVRLRGLEEFLRRARKRLRIVPNAVAVCLVTDAEMARWNHEYRGKHGPTDVLSFRFGGHPDGKAQRHRVGRVRGGADGYLGDIAIAPSVAERNARRLGRTFDSEMRILILHGLLHLMGYDHETDDGQMERRERRLRRELRLA